MKNAKSKAHPVQRRVLEMNALIDFQWMASLKQSAKKTRIKMGNYPRK
jgi:hypothetical protein